MTERHLSMKKQRRLRILSLTFDFQNGIICTHGELSERFKEPVLKTGDGATHREFESHTLRQTERPPKLSGLLAERGDSMYHGINAVELALSNSPPDCCISFSNLTKINTQPQRGWAFLGGECEIRTHGGSPHHQFSRLAP